MTPVSLLPGDPATPLDVVLVGLGGMGEVWLSALIGPKAAALGVRLAGVCEMDTARGRTALHEAGGVVPLYDNITTALSSAPDIVIDCTTPNARLAITREALMAGAHVLCEKPLAADEDTAAQLIGASARSRGHLAVSQNRRFHPGLRQLRELVNRGDLGRPQSLMVNVHMAPRFGGFRQVMRHVMLRDMAIHAFDGARAVLGTDAVSVRCIERTPEGSLFADAPEVHALFEMSNGAMFSFYGNWAEIGPPTSWNGEWRLTLAQGAARWNGEEPAQAWVAAPPDAPGFLPDSPPHPLPEPEPHLLDILGSLESLVTAIRSGTVPETHARDNSASLAMVFAAIRSADKDGRTEPVHRLRDISDASAIPPPRRSRKVDR